MMDKNDELTEQVRNVILDLGKDFELDWQREPGWVTCSMNRAEQIIALVRADERRKLREALLSGKSLVAAVDAGYQHRPNLPAHYRATTEAQLAAIGLGGGEKTP